MRKSIYTLLLLAFCVFLQFSAQAQTEPNYYIVIGVFAKLDNAVRHTNNANQHGFNAQYAINARQKWNYVYLLQTPDKRKAWAFAIRLRAESDYKDAWVFTGQLGEGQSVVEQKPVEEPVEPVLIEPVEEKDSVVEEIPVVVPPVVVPATAVYLALEIGPK